MRKIYVTAVLATGLAALSACGNQTPNGEAGPARVPVAVQASQAPPNPLGPGELPDLAGVEEIPPSAEVLPATTEPAAAEEEAAEAPEPAASPTVAKRQKWVKIFSGPSQQDITPPKSRTAGSKTVELNATENEQIGTYVADGAGRTLYRFDNDSNKPPKSVCNGDCATAWPPLLIKSPGKIFPDGLDPKILGYVERADGTCQVTINGWPVYYFVADAKPGDINGQGLNGKWFAIKPDGGKTAAAPGPLSSSGTK
ncbi:hypothetical protein Aab01nite_44630 [Paractinoplanes abujensis]|uniref:Putative lipoprotein with Yx(FWY)xxD motif n=1 Tax=Paractinoplanes abujensis TaxID=882441 RepID=A0A7W7G0Y5_9ACTN|nr:hypothetical protein [Actinoplanes abujensis]MBB4690101.1 putative lipoprotein with Yx(FWY)xxD motif [Actinoplanes abujensis]GID20873.1 hypothetical protein Aab01nite_44630 [Actinoplanes abujensis]